MCSAGGKETVRERTGQALERGLSGAATVEDKTDDAPERWVSGWCCGDDEILGRMARYRESNDEVTPSGSPRSHRIYQSGGPAQHLDSLTKS